ncbi:MAG: histidine phosphatase family protein [Myxococcota bacterium]
MTRPKLRTVRHAPALRSGVCYGQFDVEVDSPHGDSADQIIAAVRGHLIDTVWASDLSRCSVPGALVARTLGVPFLEDPALREISMGTWEGRTWSEIEEHEPDPYRRWMTEWRKEAPPGGETLDVFEARVREWHDRIEPHSTPLLVAHAGVVRALSVIRDGLDWESAMASAVPHLTLQLFE